MIDSEQGPALGSAIHAAVAAGAYPDVPTAAEAMGKVRRGVYLPDEARAAAYDELFAEYLAAARPLRAGARTRCAGSRTYCVAAVARRLGATAGTGQ